jgi:hypothetical protein
MATIPKNIIDSIQKAARNYRIALNHSNKVRDFLAKHGITPDTDDQGILDAYIDIIELAQGDAEDFISDLQIYLKDK